MIDILHRFTFVVWIVFGVLMLGFAIAGNEDAAFVFAVLFILPIGILLGYAVVKWIFTGKA